MPRSQKFRARQFLVERRSLLKSWAIFFTVKQSEVWLCMNNPPTAVGGDFCSDAVEVCRLCINHPPTAVGGITVRSRMLLKTTHMALLSERSTLHCDAGYKHPAPPEQRRKSSSMLLPNNVTECSFVSKAHTPGNRRETCSHHLCFLSYLHL